MSRVAVLTRLVAVRAVATGALPSELGPVLAEFLPKPPQPPVMDVLARLCDAYSDADHDQLWDPSVMEGTCRGERIVAFYLYDKYQSERWTISHFDDGGFDRDVEPNEWDEIDHEHEIEYRGHHVGSWPALGKSAAKDILRWPYG